MASRLANEGMTWSTRTGVQCTGAASALRLSTAERWGTPLGVGAPIGFRRVKRVLLGVLAAALTAAPVSLLVTPPAGASTPGDVTPAANVVLTGHGFGHGIGMGQWGSLGYALGADGGAGNFTYAQILTHYYGNTAVQTLGTAPAPASLNGGNVIVAMTENNNDDLIATAASGTLNVAGLTAPATAVLFHLVGPGSTYQVFTGGGCAGQGGWVLAAGAVTQPTAAATNGGPVELCQPGASIELHGSLTALANSLEQARTVNTVPLEQYVADVAPSESPSTWAALGGPGPQGQNWGFQQSEAQTVAARSYVEANPLGFGGYADTCDQTCQSYPGMKFETATSVLAAQDTAGQVMVVNGTSTVATTEYSASSGGYSAGAQFPAAVDAGDAVCISASVCNPNHSWSVTLSAASIDAAYPVIGSFSSLVVTARNGNGDFGGRVNELTVAGTSGSVSVTGSAFAGALNLKSNWFSLGNQPSGGVGGYWMDDTKGGIYSFGSAPFYGSAGNLKLNKPIVGMAATPDGLGYWLVASDGGIFTFGDATFFGSTGNLVLNKPIVGMAPTADGQGYWLVASDGGIFTFGDATFFGSTGNLVLNKPVVGMVPTHDGKGYWLVASDGGIFSFGDTTFYGSLGASPPASPVVDVAPAAGDAGYWMLEANGTVQAFGAAPNVPPAADSPALASAKSAMTSIVPSADGQGYTIVDSSGQGFSFGDAPYLGDVASVVPGYSGRVVGIAVSPG
jgi:SpoIID/LytB domain protein